MSPDPMYMKLEKPNLHQKAEVVGGQREEMGQEVLGFCCCFVCFCFLFYFEVIKMKVFVNSVLKCVNRIILKGKCCGV